MSERKIVPELLDSASDAEAGENLRDLALIDRWLGGRRALRAAVRGLPGAPPAAVLDVGAAFGSAANSISGASVTSLDLHWRHLRLAPPPRLVADAFQLPFAAASFDVVVCSLFLHHFPDDRAVELLRAFARVARRAVVVIDLERNWLAERFLPWTRLLFRWSPITLHDGPVSVRAAFTPEELAALARRAGLERIRVRRHPPWFRISLVAVLR
jgi:SAM-dependent methyltransferase